MATVQSSADQTACIRDTGMRFTSIFPSETSNEVIIRNYLMGSLRAPAELGRWNQGSISRDAGRSNTPFFWRLSDGPEGYELRFSRPDELRLLDLPGPQAAA